MKAIHCVYQIFNTKNSRSYIGSTVNFSQRKRRHFNDLKKGCHSSVFMQRDYAKCGVEAFEIRVIEQVELPSNLIAREQFWIDSLKPEYNSAKIAGSTLGIKHSIEAVLKNKERNHVLVAAMPTHATHALCQPLQKHGSVVPCHTNPEALAGLLVDG